MRRLGIGKYGGALLHVDPSFPSWADYIYFEWRVLVSHITYLRENRRQGFHSLFASYKPALCLMHGH